MTLTTLRRSKENSGNRAQEAAAMFVVARPTVVLNISYTPAQQLCEWTPPKMALKELFVFALFTIVMTMNWGTVQSFDCEDCPPPPPEDCFACPPRPNGCEKCPDVPAEKESDSGTKKQDSNRDDE